MSIKIEQDVIDSFKEKYNKNDEEQQPEEESTNERIENKIHGLDKFADFIFSKINDVAKQKHEDLGISDDELEKLSDLSIIVAKKHIPADFLENSPEGLLFLIISGILVEKTYIFNHLKKKGEIN